MFYDSLGINGVCIDETCPRSTNTAAMVGHMECFVSAIADSKWEKTTTWTAATYGNLEILMYIYENCRDVATWEDADLEEDFEDFDEDIQAYINSVREDWKAGLNKPGCNIKG